MEGALIKLTTVPQSVALARLYALTKEAGAHNKLQTLANATSRVLMKLKTLAKNTRVSTKL